MYGQRQTLIKGFVKKVFTNLVKKRQNSTKNDKIDV